MQCKFFSSRGGVEGLRRDLEEEDDVVRRFHHERHCFRSEPNQTKASKYQNKVLFFDIKATKESDYSPKPPFFIILSQLTTNSFAVHESDFSWASIGTEC